MPRKTTKAGPGHSHPELVKILAEEMLKEGVSSTPATPTIYEEEQRYGDYMHVTVIWDAWEHVPRDERGAIILDAYVVAGRQAELPRITFALGLTKKEADNLNLHP
jgi:hypothetical protein